ncbi:aldolase [Mycolicibacterium sp. 3033]|nr:aldolase [Mycolicibacterium aurantiacum]
MTETSPLAAALAAKRHVWGGWVVSPTTAGPQTFAQTGYDYVGFDIQHGYLSDADVAVLLRGLERAGIGTVVRVASSAAAPIGRVLDAGADGVIIPMVENARQAAEAVAATRYAPRGVRSFGPLRPDLGVDPNLLQARVSVFAMVETAAGAAAIDEICAVDGLAGIYIGPADLAISQGYPPDQAWDQPQVRDTMTAIHDTATAAGLISGVHAGSGARGKNLAERGFRMITLASESQALRRGAAAHLAEATDRGPERNSGNGYQ